MVRKVVDLENESSKSRHRPTIERANVIAPQHSRIFKEVCVTAFVFI